MSTVGRGIWWSERKANGANRRNRAVVHRGVPRRQIGGQPHDRRSAGRREAGDHWCWRGRSSARAWMFATIQGARWPWAAGPSNGMRCGPGRMTGHGRGIVDMPEDWQFIVDQGRSRWAVRRYHRTTLPGVGVHLGSCR